MADDERGARITRVRREPPPLRRVTLVDRAELSDRMIRITFEGDGVRDVVVEQPAASVRLLVPSAGADDLVIPEWNGNEFLLPDGSRPILRTFTPLRVDNDAGRLDLEVVRHPGGAVSGWAEVARPGASAAISGPGSGYDIPDGAERLLVLGDETALPAITQVIETAPADLHLDVHVEVVTEDAIREVGVRPSDSVQWHTTPHGEVPGGRIVGVARALGALADGTDVWAAGEASAMHAIRTHLFDELGVARRRATVRGYWKPARP